VIFACFRLFLGKSTGAIHDMFDVSHAVIITPIHSISRLLSIVALAPILTEGLNLGRCERDVIGVTSIILNANEAAFYNAKLFIAL
jgi:hypothetical protein